METVTLSNVPSAMNSASRAAPMAGNSAAYSWLSNAAAGVTSKVAVPWVG